jgi:hypothetical protein
LCENISNATFDELLFENTPSQQGCHGCWGCWRKYLAVNLRIYWETGENYTKKSIIICALANYYGSNPR